MICDRLLNDRTPVTGRVSLPASFDSEGYGSLRALGITARRIGSVTSICTGDNAPAWSPERVLGDLTVPALDTGWSPASPAASSGPSSGQTMTPAPPPTPPVIVTRQLAYLQPNVAQEVLGSLCGGFGGCSVTLIPGQPTIAVSGDPEGVKAVMEFLGDIDRPARTYRLRATLFELDRSSGRNLGVNIDLGTDVFARVLGTAPSEPGAISLGVNYAAASVAITAQEDEGRLSVLSRPQLRLMDGRPATFSASTEVPTVSQIIYDENGRQTQGIEYREAGLIMNVTLRASGQTVELELSQELSSFSGRASAAAGNPSKTKRALRSTFTVPLGEPVMIGGLLRDTTDEAGSRLPFFGLPLRRSNSGTSTEVFLLVQIDQEAQPTPPEDPDTGTGLQPGTGAGPTEGSAISSS